MISEKAAERAEEWISEAVAEGARLLTGGDRKGSMLQPTVLARTTPKSLVTREEVFAPLVIINPYETFEDGIRAHQRITLWFAGRRLHARLQPHHAGVARTGSRRRPGE